MGFDLRKLRVQVFPDRWDRPLEAWQAAGMAVLGAEQLVKYRDPSRW